MASGFVGSLASQSRGYLAFFFSCLAAFFSFMVFSGFFFSLFFESMPLLMLLSAVSSVVEEVTPAKFKPLARHMAGVI
jgi:hypothetical protein